MNAQTPQQRMRALLARTGIPYKEIDVYGSQIVITSWSLDAANRWASLIQKFATLRGITHSCEKNKTQKGTRLCETHEVWRTFGVVS